MSAMDAAAMNSTNAGCEPRHTRLRVTRRGRLSVTFVVLIGASAALVGSVLGAQAAQPAQAAQATAEGGNTFQQLTVQPGESLWSIAERVAPTADPRDVIVEVVSLNGLEGATIDPGQHLAIPAAYGLESVE